MSFDHPLARTSIVGSTAGVNGEVLRVLVVTTGLQLDREHKKYNEKSVRRLSDAIRDWLRDHADEASDFMLMNRPKKWAGDKD